MNSQRGMLSVEALRAKVESGEIDTVVTAFTDHYGRPHGKRYDAEYFLEHVVDAGTHGCNYLLTVDMEMEPVPDTATPIGNSGTAISTWFPITRRCGSPPGSIRQPSFSAISTIQTTTSRSPLLLAPSSAASSICSPSPG